MLTRSDAGTIGRHSSAIWCYKSKNFEQISTRIGVLSTVHVTVDFYSISISIGVLCAVTGFDCVQGGAGLGFRVSRERAMAERTLEIFLKSATDLKKVNKSKMHAYVVAWIDPIVRVPGPVDKTNGSNPVWNSTIKVPLAPRMLGTAMVLHIEVLGLGFLSTKPVGSVVVDLTEFMQQGATGAEVKEEFNNHQVILSTGEPQGTISFELHLKESKSLLAAAKHTQDAQRTPEILE